MPSSEYVAQEAIEEFLAVGFASIKASDSMRDKLLTLFDAGRAFFNSSAEEKLLNKLPFDTGYRPRGQEYSDSPDHPDDMESFSVSRRLQESHAGLNSYSAKNLYNQMLELFGFLEPLVENFTTHLAAKVAGSTVSHEFRGAFGEWSLLQMNYSRPAQACGEYINDCHEDGCLMTVISVTGPGLELRASDGSFIPVFPKNGEILLMSGEILFLLSGGKIPPIYHRVRATLDFNERMSLLFFADMHPSLCSPWITNETNIDVDIGNRVLDNSTRYGLTKWTLA
jgi:isopenicillin N synthase-like dioxygenase